MTVSSAAEKSELVLSSSIEQPAIKANSNSARDLFRYWQIRILYSMGFGYAAFYFVRQNFSLVIPSLSEDLGYTKTQLGLILTIWSIVYGAGKFLNGYYSDRSNARYFMSAGLLGAALTCLVMGLSSSWWFFVIAWSANAWFQSMGWPPVSRLLTHWFSPRELGTMWGITNMSHQVGGALIAITAGYLIPHYGWRSVFIMPAILSLVLAFVLYNRLRDTPESLDLPSVEAHSGLKEIPADAAADNMSPKQLFKQLFYNKMLWYVCLGNMFLYIVRMGVFNWAPTFLKEFKGASITSSGWQVAGFEFAGMIGGVAAGWISDKLFDGRRGPVSCLYMIAMVGALIYFWLAPAGLNSYNVIAMMIVGFLVYGPQVLVGVAAADFASKKAVGMAVGLTGSFGYLGSAVSGVSIGLIADNYGWDWGFIFFIASAIGACVCFGLTWHKRAAVLEKSEL